MGQAKYPILITLVAIFFLVELSVSIYAKSLALQTDALHMLSDLIALTIGYIAIRLTMKEASARYTYGWLRAEILGGLINSVFLLAICFTLLIEVIEKVVDLANNPPDPQLEKEINWVLGAAGVGLVVNLLGLCLFAREHHHHDPSANRQARDEENALSLDEIIEKETANFNDMAVMLHIIGDTMGSVAVIISSLLIKYLDHPAKFYADPTASFLIVIFIGFSSFKLLRKTGHILMHRSHELNYPELLEKIKALPEIAQLHEFHIWPLNGQINIASLHVRLQPQPIDRTTDDIIREIKGLLHEYGIHSSTIQPELDPESCLEPRCRQNCHEFRCCSEEMEE